MKQSFDTMMMLTLLFTLLVSSAWSLTRPAEDRLNHKLAKMNDHLSKMEESLQQLQEQGNNWNIFKNNMAIWNAQLEAVEQKLTVTRRTQAEQLRKQTRLQLTLNHVLSKLLTWMELGGLACSLHDTALLERLSRLNNALKELDSQEVIKRLPGQALDKLEQKLNILLISLQPKDVQQMQLLIHKQAGSLESIQALLKKILNHQKASAKRWQNATAYCALTSTDFDQINEIAELLEIDSMQPGKVDCYELQDPRVDGVYKFLVPEVNELQRDFNERYCAFATSGPAWTVIQNRGPFAEQETFNRSWDDYRAGFGSLDKDFWFGNEFIHKIVYRDNYVLRIELQDFGGKQHWAEYELFRLDSESYNYNLGIDFFNGTLLNAFHYGNNMDFSTYDHLSSQNPNRSNGKRLSSGWWYDSCDDCNLNDIYRPSGSSRGITSRHWHRNHTSWKAARMMIRPLSFNITAADQSYDDYEANPEL